MATSPLAAPLAWDLVAESYTADIMPLFERFAAEALRLAAVAAGAPIVDVAAGPGTLALLAARAGHPVTAIDFSPQMVARLEARVAAAGLPGVTALVGDGMALPLPSGAFAGGFSMFGLMFFPDRARGFAELARVLAPGARAVVSSWLPLDRAPVLAAALAALAEVDPPPPGMAAHIPPLVEAAACRAEMEAAGFTDVAAHEVTAVATAPSIDAMWAMYERSSAPFALSRMRHGARWSEITAAVGERLRARFGAGPIESPMPAWLTVGTRG